MRCLAKTSEQLRVSEGNRDTKQRALRYNSESAICSMLKEGGPWRTSNRRKEYGPNMSSTLTLQVLPAERKGTDSCEMRKVPVRKCCG